MLSAEHRRPLAAFGLVLGSAGLILGHGVRDQFVRVLVDSGAPSPLLGAIAPDMVLGQSLRHEPAAPRPVPEPRAVERLVALPVLPVTPLRSPREVVSPLTSTSPATAVAEPSVRRHVTAKTPATQKPSASTPKPAPAPATPKPPATPTIPATTPTKPTTTPTAPSRPTFAGVPAKVKDEVTTTTDRVAKTVKITVHGLIGGQSPRHVVGGTRPGSAQDGRGRPGEHSHEAEGRGNRGFDRGHDRGQDRGRGPSTPAPSVVRSTPATDAHQHDHQAGHQFDHRGNDHGGDHGSRGHGH